MAGRTNWLRGTGVLLLTFPFALAHAADPPAATPPTAPTPTVRPDDPLYAPVLAAIQANDAAKVAAALAQPARIFGQAMERRR